MSRRSPGFHWHDQSGFTRYVSIVLKFPLNLPWYLGMEALQSIRSFEEYLNLLWP